MRPVKVRVGMITCQNVRLERRVRARRDEAHIRGQHCANLALGVEVN